MIGVTVTILHAVGMEYIQHKLGNNGMEVK